MKSIPAISQNDFLQDHHLVVVEAQSAAIANGSQSADHQPTDISTRRDCKPAQLPSDSVAIELKPHCQHQLHRLCQQLPTLAARLVYLDSSYRSVATNWSPDNSADPAELLPDIPPQFLDRFHSAIPPHSSTITLHLLEAAETESQTPKIYLCPFRQTGDRYEYLFLKTERPLTDAERTLINFWVESLSTILPLLRNQKQDQQQLPQASTQKLRQLEHQLRNPLAAIELFSHVLSMELPEGPLQDQANAIHDAVETISDRLTQSLKDAAADVPKSWCNLEEIFVEAIALLQPRWQAKDLSIEVPDRPTSVYVQRSQIQQVVENLLDNAIAYSPEKDMILCQWWGDAQKTSVEICDRGPGIPEDDLESVFLPHHSRRPGGSGMGLTIAQTYIHHHGGQIGCQNLPGGGAQFFFTLPSQISKG